MDFDGFLMSLRIFTTNNVLKISLALLFPTPNAILTRLVRIYLAPKNLPILLAPNEIPFDAKSIGKV